MNLYIDKYSAALIEIDLFANKIPILSTITNCVNLIFKGIIFPFLNQDFNKNYYFSYLNDKDSFDCILLLVPIFGNLMSITSPIKGKNDYARFNELRPLSDKSPEKMEKSKEQALFYLNRAAAFKFPPALSTLGKLYQTYNDHKGRYPQHPCEKFVEPDDSHAFNLFREAAALNDKGSMFELYKCFRFGQGTEKNETEALRWLEKFLCDTPSHYHPHHKEAATTLGRIYLYGECGVTSDKDKGFALIKKAVECHKDNSLGKFYLYECFRYGWGTAVDEVEAKKWLVEAGEYSSNLLAVDLGICYLYGQLGFPRDEKKGFAKLDDKGKSSPFTSSKNKFYLYKCYADGLGTEKDSTKARKYLEEAVAMKFPYPEAVRELEMIKNL